MRLIDADKVNVVEYAGLVHIPPDDYLGLCAFFKKQLIDEQPTITPEDCRPHGRWIINPDGYYPYCSECKEEPEHGEMTNYCPNCGAKMDGKEQ